MVDPVSIFTIIGAIAALITGFKDAASIFRKWLKKHRLKKQDGWRKLNGILDSSSDVIRQQYESGRQELGVRFEEGDVVSISEMVRILIRMQESLIDVLKTSIEQTTCAPLNCSRLCEAALMARQESVSTITRLSERLRYAAPSCVNRIEEGANAPGAVRSSRYGSDLFRRSTCAPEPHCEYLYSRQQEQLCPGVVNKTEHGQISGRWGNKTEQSQSSGRSSAGADLVYDREGSRARSTILRIPIAPPATPIDQPGCRLGGARHNSVVRCKQGSYLNDRSDGVTCQALPIEQEQMQTSECFVQIPPLSEPHADKVKYQSYSRAVRNGRGASYECDTFPSGGREPDCVQVASSTGPYPQPVLVPASHHRMATPITCQATQYIEQSSPEDWGCWHWLFEFDTDDGRGEAGDVPNKAQCRTCQSCVSLEPFHVHRGHRRYKATARFMARCHIPSTIRGGFALFRCSLCVAPKAVMLKSSNELWAHLEQHSADSLEGGADIVAVR